MYIDRLILIFIIGGYIVSPAIIEWSSIPGGAWYRPYLIWTILIGIGFWVTRSKDLDDF